MFFMLAYPCCVNSVAKNVCHEKSQPSKFLLIRHYFHSQQVLDEGGLDIISDMTTEKTRVHYDMPSRVTAQVKIH